MGNKQIVNAKICIFLVYFFLSFPPSFWLIRTAVFSVSGMHTLVFLWRMTNIHQIALECNFEMTERENKRVRVCTCVLARAYDLQL